MKIRKDAPSKEVFKCDDCGFNKSALENNISGEISTDWGEFYLLVKEQHQINCPKRFQKAREGELRKKIEEIEHPRLMSVYDKNGEELIYGLTLNECNAYIQKNDPKGELGYYKGDSY